jgi:predicted nucleotidyltransferase
VNKGAIVLGLLAVITAMEAMMFETWWPGVVVVAAMVGYVAMLAWPRGATRGERGFDSRWGRPGFARMGRISMTHLPAEAILRIARAHGAYDVRVFGSSAREDARPDSDLDLLVRFEEGRSLVDLVCMKLALEELLGIRVDVVSERGLSRYIRDGVLTDAKTLAA